MDTTSSAGKAGLKKLNAAAKNTPKWAKERIAAAVESTTRVDQQPENGSWKIKC